VPRPRYARPTTREVPAMPFPLVSVKFREYPMRIIAA
jgi:hypothetical protein